MLRPASKHNYLNVICVPSDPELANFANKTNWECKSGHFQLISAVAGGLLVGLLIWLVEEPDDGRSEMSSLLHFLVFGSNGPWLSWLLNIGAVNESGSKSMLNEMLQR